MLQKTFFTIFSYLALFSPHNQRIKIKIRTVEFLLSCSVHIKEVYCALYSLKIDAQHFYIKIIFLGHTT